MSDTDRDEPQDEIDLSAAAQQIVMLTHEESIRSTSLMLALKYHSDTIVKDAAMYSQLRMEGRNLAPSHADMVIETARCFEHYIRVGHESVTAENGDTDTALIAGETA